MRIGRAPDCHASHADVPGSNPADPTCTWVFQRNIASPSQCDVSGGLAELRAMSCALLHAIPGTCLLVTKGVRFGDIIPI